jgi:hypothetical protein
MARALSDTFAGIAPAGVPAFLAAQIVGMLAVGAWLWGFGGTSAALPTGPRP